MSLRQRITRNATFKVLGEAGGRLAGMLFYILFARWLGAQEFGRYSFALSYAALFAIVVDLGTNTIITRELARDRSLTGEFVPRLNALKTFSSVLALVLIGVSLLFFSYDLGTKKLVLAMGLFVIGTGLLEYFCAVLSGLERMGREAFLKTANKLLVLAGGAAGFFLYRTLASTVAGLLLGMGLSLVLGYGFLFRQGAPAALRWNWPWAKKLLAQSLPLLASWVFWNFYDNQDIVLLSFLGRPMNEVGWFAAAMKLLDVFRGVPVLMAGAFFPVLANFARTDPDHFTRLARFLMRWIVAVALPLAAGTAMLAGPIVAFIYGADFLFSARILTIAVWAAVGIFINHVFINLLVALDMQNKTIVGAAVAAGTNLLLILVLVPWGGLLGAAAALPLSEAVYLVINSHFTHKRVTVFDGPFWRYLLKPVAATALMAATLWFLPSWNVFILAAVGAAVYAAALLALRGVPTKVSALADPATI
ncbi:MAG TPA: flippase [Elusimicrobiota bacterium]|nr:flippase [Elusimicrobiota bacterium]